MNSLKDCAAILRQNSDSGYNILTTMRKSIVIILAIAVLGILGLYTANKNQTPHLVSASGTSSSNSSSQTMPMASSSSPMSNFKDGTYTGANEMTPYGDVQIAVIIKGGKIADVNFLQMPSDLEHSAQLTSLSMPLLKQTTIQSQSANIDFVSGATSTSIGYEQSLQAALDQAAIHS